MSKVTMYEGHEVPDGATYYTEESACQRAGFYKWAGGQLMFKSIAFHRTWVKSINSEIPSCAIELPEEPMPSKAEWMPEVGDEIQICFDNVDRELLGDNEVGINGNLVTFIGSLVNGAGQTIFIFDDAHNFSDCYPSECFVKPKTAEEKKRDAFIESFMSALSKETNREFWGKNYDGIISDLIKAGFTAPEGEE